MELLLSLSVLKFPFGFKIFLNIIPILVGLIYILKTRKISLFVFPTLLIIGINLVVLIFQKDIGSILRLGQLICMIGFTCFISSWITPKKLLLISKYILCLSAIVFFFEILFIGPMTWKVFIYNLSLPSYTGPVGEPNYSAIIFAILSMIFWYYKKWIFWAISLVFILLCASRTGLAVALLFPIFNLIFIKKKKALMYLGFFIILITSLTPLFLLLIENFTPLEFRTFLEKASAGRYYIQIVYVDMGLKNLFGVGYFNGWDSYMEYITPYLPIIDSIRGHQNNEQHSLFMQVFSEFGPICYLLFIVQIIYLLKKIYKNNSDLIFMISIVCLGYCFLNGLSDFILYLILGFALSSHKGEFTIKTMYSNIQLLFSRRAKID